MPGVDALINIINVADKVGHYAPDPMNPGKFKLLGYSEPAWSACEWCGGEYDGKLPHCPNCGGPRTAKRKGRR